MNNHLTELTKEYGKCGSWALWDENGNLPEKFEDSIKPGIIFMGLNASTDLSKEALDWKNFHFIEKENKITWNNEHCRKLAKVLIEPKFSRFSGAYMTDVIKDCYDSQSTLLMKKLREEEKLRDPKTIEKNKEKLERELKLLSKISGSEEFTIICVGNDSFNLTKKMLGANAHNIYKIFHYSNWSDPMNKTPGLKGWQKVTERIRRELSDICL